MIELEPGRYLIETPSELPNFASAGARRLFVDFETTSQDKKLKSLNPWHNCKICGIAISADITEATYYIPVLHAPELYGRYNLNREDVKRWLIEQLEAVRYWCNQNPKYDIQALANDFGYSYTHRVVDTVVLAKLFNTDLMDYSLDLIASFFLKKDISGYTASLQPYLADNQDYGRIPPDVLGAYACEDVVTVKQLFAYFAAYMPSDTLTALELEVSCTSVLAKIERNGLRVNPTDLEIKTFLSGHKLLRDLSDLQELAKFPNFNPNSVKHMQELFVNRLGLPVLKWTNEDDEEATHNPSFTKHVLREYLVLPKAPVELVKRLIDYKINDKFYSAFLKPWCAKHVNGKLHASYNQLVRSGRMACRDPNAQQLNEEAKKLIIPNEGCALLSIDQSQVEFRLIAHYIQDQRVLDSFRNNPDTDFHQWVAQTSGIARKPAKTVNFLMAYGGGKGMLLTALMKEPDLMDSIRVKVLNMVSAGELTHEEADNVYRSLAYSVAEGTYNTYHGTLPTLRPTMKDAERAAKRNGYVTNLYGRRRHLQPNQCYKAFNSACQGSAADLIKQSLTTLDGVCDALGIRILAVVHDEILFEGPIETIEKPSTVRALLEVMESPRPLEPLLVPIRCSYGSSRVSWYDAGKQGPDKKGYAWPVEEAPWLHAQGFGLGW